jgi:predicted acetyltransferase
VTGIDIRPLTEADDIEAELDLRRRAFGPISAAERPDWVAAVQASIRAGALIGVFDGKRLVASARYHPMRQWWRGRSLAMAGVAGVKVAPELRGRGTGKAMMTALLTEISHRGYPVSVLYPSTVPLYRSMGWELAGGRYETYLPARSLGQLAPADPLLGSDGELSAAAGGSGPASSLPPGNLRRAEPGDEPAVVKVIGEVHAALQQCGPSTRDPAELDGWFADEDHFAYVADDGFLSYQWSRGHREIDVRWLVAGSAATARGLWQILASHGSMADRIRTCLAPDDPVSWLTREADAALRLRGRWMLRLVDAPAAIAGRGFPAGSALSVPLELADRQLPANAGRWQLTIAGGTGALDPAGEPAAQPDNVLRLSARGLAALYAGIPLATLRLAGLAAGGAANDDALDGAFACTAFMIDNF